MSEPDDRAALAAWEQIMALAREHGLGVQKSRAYDGGWIVLASPAYQRAHVIGPHGRHAGE